MRLVVFQVKKKNGHRLFSSLEKRSIMRFGAKQQKKYNACKRTFN
jgi:hypothetical protein